MTAIQNGFFNEQIIPVDLQDGRTMQVDEGVRQPPDRQKMGALRPVFELDGVVTAGNSSQISDGSSAVVLASPKIVGRYNLQPTSTCHKPLCNRFRSGLDAGWSHSSHQVDFESDRHDT